jgi:hypothetical protein
LLKVFDITNLKKIDGSINLSDSIKLETFKALGSHITGATFAAGANLKHLYLPNTINSLNLTAADNLNKIVYNKDEIKTTLNNGDIVDTECMFIEDMIYTNDNGVQCTNINNINIDGCDFKLYTYEFIKKLTEAKENMNENGITSKFGIQLKNVHWTPYSKLGEGAIYDRSNAENYKYATNNFSFDDYTYNANTWENDIAEGRIYLLESSDIQPIDSLDLLDKYIEDNKTIFVNATNVNPVSYPVITGDLYVDNDESISETLLANHYKNIFPGLNIKAKLIADAYRARFVHTYDGVEKEIDV